MKSHYLSGRTFPCFSIKIAVCALLLVLLSNAASVFGVTVDRVLATVGGEIITLTEYKQFLKAVNREDSGDVDQALLRQLVEERIIIQEAKRKGFEASDSEVDTMVEEFKSRNGLSQEDLEVFLRGEGAGIKDYRQALKGRVLLSKLVSSDVDSKVIIREKELEDYYKEHKNEFVSSPEKIEVKAVFLRLREDASVTEITDLKRRALKVVALAKEGYNFDSLIGKYCDEPLKSQDGALGKFAKGGLIPPLDYKAFSMKEGEISDPIWVSEGAYIIQVVSRSGEIYKKLDEVKEEIRSNLYIHKREKIYNEWVKALWDKFSITINQS